MHLCCICVAFPECCNLPWCCNTLLINNVEGAGGESVYSPHLLFNWVMELYQWKGLLPWAPWTANGDKWILPVRDSKWKHHFDHCSDSFQGGAVLSLSADFTASRSIDLLPKAVIPIGDNGFHNAMSFFTFLSVCIRNRAIVWIFHLFTKGLWGMRSKGSKVKGKC